MCSRKWIVRISALLLIGSLLATGVFAAEGDSEVAALSGTPLTNGLLEANSNRQVHPFRTEIVESRFTTEGFEKIGETEKLEIFLNREEAALRVRNIDTGYLWGALPIGEAEGLNSSWRCYGNGLVSIECFNSEGVESRVSIGKDGMAQYELLDHGLLCSAVFEEQGISFQVKVCWEGSQITMELVEGTLVEGLHDSPFTLKSMTFLPFLGSSYSDSVDGYILIPDGSGALIRYRQPANYSSTYAARIYGKDYGIESLASTADNTARPEAQALLPIYGMVHGAGQNGFLAVVENGAAYATILAAPAQTSNPYNWAAARFEFRQKYVKNINRKEGAGANVPQKVPNKVIPRISFYFTEGEQARYDGMAVMYRQMLMQQGVLSPLHSEDRSVPLQLEVLGADKKENFLWNTTEVFTTFAQAEEIRESLANAGITNLEMVLRGYTKNNECGSRLLASLGSRKELAALSRALSETGGALSLYLNPMTANEDQITLRTEAANNLSKNEIKWIDNLASRIYPYTYLYRLTEVEERVQKAITNDYGSGFALAQVSNKLYSDFTSGRELTRGESLDRVIAMVESLTDGKRIAMYQPNQYLWQYTDKMFDLPVSNSQILYETDCVPFLQIVLSGCVELYGSTINASSYSTERLLRQIEYGMAPAFVVTGCESVELFNTAQERYFSTNFLDWQPQIVQAYRTVSEGLGDVWGHSIVSHRCLQNGLIRVEYDNGVGIYLNYTDEPLTADGITVESGWFSVTGGGGT
ncbi:MAG: DUF5696 domain-containing protein [Clostridiales bacterium]|nr:DUF5696 domain-containing protein [Clostridiales bacterium]